MLWTSSGPSASRSVRAIAHMRASGKSSRDAAAAVDLDRLVEHPQRRARGDDLDRRDLDAGVRCPTVSISHAVLSTSKRACSMRQRASAIQSWTTPLSRRADAEGMTVLGAADHQVERPLRHADRPHAVVDPARAEPGLGDHVARRPRLRSGSTTGTLTSSKLTSPWPPRSW